MFLTLALLAPSRTLVGKSIRLAPMTALRIGYLMPFHNPGRLLHTSTSAKNPDTEQAPLARSHIASFFAQYPKFEYDPLKPFMDEFRRLIVTEGFGRRGAGLRTARKEMKVAIVRQFKDIYGTHTCDIHVWHQFFNAIGIDETPQTMSLCYKRVQSINLNICDLIDRPVTGVQITMFPNVTELSRYTFKDINRPKTVPRISTQQDPIVGRLLRPLINPRMLKVKGSPPVSSVPVEVMKNLSDVAPGASL